MAGKQPSVVKRSLYSWVFHKNLKLQILLLVVIVLAVFARVFPLEMQKRIINEAINLRRLDLLYIYCGFYLAAVVTASLMKYLINVLETLIGQRATAEMRKALYHHILTLPLNFFRKTQPGSVVNALIAELTIPGNFVGMAVAVPISNLLTLLAFAGYLFWLNPLLAIISLSIYPLVLIIIPLLQKKVNESNKRRVDISRTLSSRIAETVSGIHEVQGNGAFQIENKKFDRLVNKLLKIRIVWSLYRFGIKATNSFFTSLGPFLVFILGGYLAINGRLELGALVAFLSAQEKLYDPWKELIEFYQVFQDGFVNYDRTMSFFDGEPDHELEPDGRPPLRLDGSIEVKDLYFETDSGIRLLDGINLTLKPGEHMALVGSSGSGKSTLAQCIGQLYKYTGGHVRIEGQEVTQLTKRDIVHNFGIVAQAPFIFSGSLEENLLYSILAQGGNGQPAKPEETLSLDDIISVLQQTGVFADVLRFGLNTILSYSKNQELINTLVKVRQKFQDGFGEKLADYVEFFSENEYLHHSSISDNLIFGTPKDPMYETQYLPRNKAFNLFLDEADLTRPLLSLGAELSRQTVDILGNLPPDMVFFEQSPIAPEELEEYKQIVKQLKQQRLHQLSETLRSRLLELALRFTPGVHKMVSLPTILETLILEGRALFKEQINSRAPATISFYQMSEYIFSQTILSNIFFGKIKTTNPQAQEKITQAVIQLLIEEDLLESIVEIGMHFQVGSKGDRLSGGQRQKLAIARVFLKKPRVLIMDEATSALDNNSQARIQSLLENRWKGHTTLISVVHRLDIIQNYDKVAVMKAGKIGELGTYEELIAKKGMLYELIGKK